MKDWEKYEKFVAMMCSEEFQSSETTIIANAKIKGALSKVERQIDVLIDSRLENELSKRVIVDAKRYTRKLNVRDVDLFHGVMLDCSASRGILVCANGFTPAALQRAQDFINIRIVSLDEVESLDLTVWDHCQNESCKSEGVLWDSPMHIGAPEMGFNIVVLGKCDKCYSFHLWCWGCGNKFCMGDEDEAKCSCDVPWFWLTSIEEDNASNGDKARSAYLLLVSANDVFAADRRPL